MTFTQAKSYLDSFINYEFNLNAIPLASFKLQRVEYLLELLGRPQEKIRFIHVAGTKGKGSTCAFAANILKSAGYKVGLYTSPHIKDFKERIRVLVPDRPGCCVADSAPAQVAPSATQQPGVISEIFPDCIRDHEVCALLEEMKPGLERVRANSQYGQLSYFEVLTALAFCYFQRQEVDFAVLETGLGGRLDATNVVYSLVYGLTPISLEHTRQLGETLEAIAREKAAIIKASENRRKSPFPRRRRGFTEPIAIIAPQPEEAIEVIQRRCREEGVKSFLVGRDIEFKVIHRDISGQTFHIKGIRHEYDLNTRLLGLHQIINAATAVGMIESLASYGIPIREGAVQQGISDTVWPGRFEILRQKPTVILDGAHNPGSSQRVAETVKAMFPRKKVILILGLSDDKDISGIFRNLDAISRKIILTRADHPRAWNFIDGEAEKVFKTKNCVRTNNVREAVEEALTKAADEDVVLVTGSMFVIGEAREILLNHAVTQ